MSIDIPAWGAGEMMVRARPKLFKKGWSQSENGRLDCIEKVFGEVKISTIWAGHQLLLSGNKVGEADELKATVFCDDPVFKEAIAELVAVFEPIIRRNKKRWDKEIKEYEKRYREWGEPDFKFTRSEKYGV